VQISQIVPNIQCHQAIFLEVIKILHDNHSFVLRIYPMKLIF